MSFFLDLLFPPRCPFCTSVVSEKTLICPECFEKLPFIKGRACLKCGAPIGEFAHDLCLRCKTDKPYFDRAFIPLIYKESASSSIIRFKFYEHPSYARALAFLMADKIIRSDEFKEGFSFITFVPQNKNSRRRRGYNQARLIAKELSSILDLPLLDTLIRKDDSVRQVTLDGRARKINAQKSYSPKDISLSGTALLVDDVFTTGATASYCARLLKKMGCKKVYVTTCAMRVWE